MHSVPSFRGDFIYSLPSTELDVALLWTPYDTLNLRTEYAGNGRFPIWSWSAWDGRVGWSCTPTGAQSWQYRVYSRVIWIDPQLAYLGMGNMGQAMSKNLVVKGKLEKPLIIWNRTHRRATDHSLRIGHSIPVDTIEEAVTKSDIIWSCLVNQEAVVETFDSILKNDIKGKLFIETSTITPEVTNEISRQVIDAGGEFVAMPVLGEPTMANAGVLTCVPSGLKQSVERVLPYLTGVIAREVIDFSGEEPGRASLLKLIGNVFIINTMETVAEGHVLAEKTGLGISNLQKFIAAIFPTGPSMIYSKRMSTGDYYKSKPMVEISDARGLASHVLDLAEGCGTNLASYKAAVGHLAAAEAYTGPSGDIAGIYGAVRLESGLSYENDSI